MVFPIYCCHLDRQWHVNSPILFCRAPKILLWLMRPLIVLMLLLRRELPTLGESHSHVSVKKYELLGRLSLFNANSCKESFKIYYRICHYILFHFQRKISIHFSNGDFLEKKSFLKAFCKNDCIDQQKQWDFSPEPRN